MVVISENTHCGSMAASIPSYNHSSGQKRRVPVLLGPTATGKSSLAIKLAHDLDCEIISCDSRQIYKGMDIGTAKVSSTEREGVVHWLIDIIKPDKSYSAFQFAHDCAEIIRDRSSQGKRLLICGGTGLYFKILAEGGRECVDSDPELRLQLKEFADMNGMHALHAQLQQVDPFAAQKIHPNDLQRTIRALAVFRQTGRSLFSFNERSSTPSPFDFPVFILSLPREQLYSRINRRVEDMIKHGLYTEFQQLRNEGYHEESPGMRSVGYRELFAVERGELSLATSIALIQQSTRRYAKRQTTWFTTQTAGTALPCSEKYGLIRSLFAEIFNEKQPL